jgi:hypothetical protein
LCKWYFEEGVLDKYNEWLIKAAEGGYVEAQRKVASYHMEGNGSFKLSEGKALEWFKKAAEQGNANAQYNVGVMFQDGQGVPKDLIKAKEWIIKAANQGFEEAQDALKNDAELNSV